MKEKQMDSGSSANTTKRSGTNYSTDVLKKTLFMDELSIIKDADPVVVEYFKKRIKELTESTSR